MIFWLAKQDQVHIQLDWKLCDGWITRCGRRRGFFRSDALDLHYFDVAKVHDFSAVLVLPSDQLDLFAVWLDLVRFTELAQIRLHSVQNTFGGASHHEALRAEDWRHRNLPWLNLSARIRTERSSCAHYKVTHWYLITSPWLSKCHCFMILCWCSFLPLLAACRWRYSVFKLRQRRDA